MSLQKRLPEQFLDCLTDFVLYYLSFSFYFFCSFFPLSTISFVPLRCTKGCRCNRGWGSRLFFQSYGKPEFHLLSRNEFE